MFLSFDGTHTKHVAEMVAVFNKYLVYIQRSLTIRNID